MDMNDGNGQVITASLNRMHMHRKKENAHNKDRIKSSRFPLECRE